MYVYNDAKTTLNRSIKKEHFMNSDTVSISSINGNAIILYIIEPNNFGNFQSSISVNELVGGYQKISDVGDAGDSTGQLRATINCIPHIQCYSSKTILARAVARIQIPLDNNRVAHCTGTLINNELNNGRPYFLTAFHCIDMNNDGILDNNELQALRRWMFQFRFWRAQCNGNTNNPFIQFNGAILRSQNRGSDMVLLELIDQPGIGDGVNYAGWSRQTSASSNSLSFVIHHPRGEDMRYSQTRFVRNFLFNSNYWQAGYSTGVVAPGSSGSSLFNENNQIIGQLKGGASSCNYTDFSDRYGKFNRSWDNGNLRPWLSPNQVLQSTGLLNLTDIPINGPSTIACTTPAQFSTLPNLLDVTYEWTVTTGMQILSGQGTSTVTISGFPNNNVGSGFLTLTLRSPTKGRTRIYTTNKQVFISNGSVLGTYNSPTNSAEPLAPFTRFNQVTNNTCLSVATNMTIPAGSTVTWSGPANTSEIIWGQSGNNVNIYFSELNQEIVLSLSVTNSCGTRNLNYRFTCTSTNSCGIAPLRVALSPNPSSNNMQVSLTDKSNTNLKMDISEIRIIDKSGSIKLRNTYGVGQKNVNLNISTLIPDVYTILVFDKRTWTSEKFIKN
jgi:V8-like Glu-specific endopeptidase